MPCNKENCKCHKCGKIADKVVDPKVLASDSSSNSTPEQQSHSKEQKRNSNISSTGNSSYVVYKQEYPSKQSSGKDENPSSKEPTENKDWSASDTDKDFIKMVRNSDRLQDLDNNEEPITDPEEHSSEQFIIEEEGKKEDPPEADVPVRRFSVSMREDFDKPLQPLRHHESNDTLPVLQTIDLDQISSSIIDDPRAPEKGYAKNTKQFKKLLQSIVDSSDKILNTLDKSKEKAGELSSNKPDDDKPDGEDKSRKGLPRVVNVHHIQFDPTRPVSINIPLNIHFNKSGKRIRTPEKTSESKTVKSCKNVLKTSSESMNIYFPKASYKGLSSDLDLTEKVLTERYKNETSSTNGSHKHEIQEVKPKETSSTNDSHKHEVIPENHKPLLEEPFKNDIETNPIQPIEESNKKSEQSEQEKLNVILNRSEVSHLDSKAKPVEHRKKSYKESKTINDNPDLKLPVNFPQQRDIKVCVPCYCDKCPLFDALGNLVCPEKCGCCTCAYVMSEVNPDERTELELCRCTSKTQFNTIGRSYVQRCQCSRRVDLCPCRDKYGSLGEKVPEFEDDTLNDIKKRQTSLKASLRLSRLSAPRLVIDNTNENTTTTSTTTPTDDSGAYDNIRSRRSS